MKLSQAAIKEIAIHLEGGAICYINKRTGEIKPYANKKTAALEEDPEVVEQQRAEIEHMEAKPDLYLKIEQMPSAYRLQVMRDFIEELREPDVMRELKNALNRKKPMRNFAQVVGSDEILNQHWFNFNAEEYQRWVSNFIIDAYNY